MTGLNKELVAYRMSRADETLEDARILANAERWNACVNRLYYACFYAISALLLRDGLSSTRHSGIRGLFNREYVKPGKIPRNLARIFNDLFERRQEGDYVDFVSFKGPQVTPWISQADELIRHIACLVQSSQSSK